MEYDIDLVKEKARSLTQWFFDATDHMSGEEATLCALKVCDEMLNEAVIDKHYIARGAKEFWEKVRQELIFEDDAEEGRKEG